MGSEATLDLVPTVLVLWPAVLRRRASPLGSPRGHSTHTQTRIYLPRLGMHLFFLDARFTTSTVCADADSQSDSDGLFFPNSKAHFYVRCHEGIGAETLAFGEELTNIKT